MKEPSGRFVVRIPPDLHERARRHAYEHGISLNECCRRALQEYLAEKPPAGPAATGPEERWVRVATEMIGEDLTGVVLFGSVARGEAATHSDIDLLVVTGPSIPLSRALYATWDEACPNTAVSPHFVHLPEDVFGAGSLWYEVAIDGIVLFEKERLVTGFLRTVRKAIADRLIERRDAYGHGYWIKHEPEMTHVQ